ncbi:DNA repair protein RAD51 -like protein 4 R51H3 RAD51 -like protein D RAD51-like protein 3 [Channa argus]|uniref:DNA repair protein RAD51-like protein 4 R51H3 RAD51-like protein D RAD51-like protein 3 n=1 Tax=Channa argus TaxID=215402 RepID=A0A6G1QTI6_CHAAH|nr:DNA repair protein RAD51 -like protein 4 R51H3 RAD51 -like protein D RAD51-like protein 3 [Channa argus]
MVVLREGMCPGLSEDLVRDLRAAGVKTVEELVSSDIEGLAQKCSVSYKALFAIRRVLLAQHTAFPVSGADLYEELLSSTAILSTGNPSLDKLLDSGLYTGEITELSGGPGSGKSQVCFGVAVHISYHLKQSVIYIDTTGGLTASRLLQMLKAETSNTEEQASVGGGSVKAVIVDSVSAVISPLLGGKQNEGMSLMIQVAGVLKTMAKDFNVAALVTNHVTRGGNGEVLPGLGASWSHIPRTRILLERVERAVSISCSSLRSATLIKSSRQVQAALTFTSSAAIAQY